MSEFIHLHNHSHYSLLDAICTPEGLIQAAIKNNMPAIALTDHGVMYGAMEFYKKAKAKKIKPIIGCEVYIVLNGSRFDRGKPKNKDDNFGDKKNGKDERKGNYQHLVLLCKNFNGYKNLVKLVSKAQTEGFYYKPRIDIELLKEYSKDLIALSACAGGVVSAFITRKDHETAKQNAILFKQIFNDDFYLEIQNHDMEIEASVIEYVPKLAKELGIKIVGTNDIHYINKEHSIPHNIFLYINTDLSKDKENISVEKNLRYGTDQVYFKSAKEMADLFKDHPEAISSTIEIADKCNLELPKGIYHMPDFPIPPEYGVHTLDEYLRKVSLEGLKQKLQNHGEKEISRLNTELDVITKMKFSGYFLIVADFVKYAKTNGILVGPGRGSAAGSLVCFALGITHVNPLDYDLFFERFLNPDRVSMPDIDIDFQDDKRDEVIQYLKDKYGQDSVCQIITFNKLKTKAVLKDVGRVLNYPFDTINEVTKQVPSVFGKIKSLEKCYKEIPDFKKYFDSDEGRKKLLKYAVVLENLNKNASVHASGVVIAPSDITNYAPICRTTQADAQYMSQYDMKMLEEAGLLKMDILGLKELKIIDKTLKLIEQRYKKVIDLDELKFDDQKTYEIFSNGHTVGIFQFSKSKMREYLCKLKPKNINDLAAMNALYRPGPMDLIPEFIDKKYGRKEITYLHPKMEPILKDTYGIIVYQEQVMKLVQEIAGYSLSKADSVRRAMGKKDEKAMKQQEEEFIAGAAENNINKKQAKEIFALILKFADYGFNKSHSVAYSILAYYTAFLKCHYPIEFMTSQLNSRKDNSDEMVILINELRRMKIKLSLPNLNECDSDFKIDTKNDNTILYGLSSIKNVGGNAVLSITKERESNGIFLDFVDFCSRIDTRQVTKKTVESLIYAGAFDEIEPNRKKLSTNYDTILTRLSGKKTKSENESLFDMSVTHQSIKQTIYSSIENNIDDWDYKEKLSLEKKVLNVYLSSHPLADYENEIEDVIDFRFSDAEITNDETETALPAKVKLAGIISDTQVKTSKRGTKYCTFTLEDFSGHGECVIFNQPFEQLKEFIKNDEIVVVTAKPEENGTAIKLIVDNVVPLAKSDDVINVKTLIINIESAFFEPEKLYKIKEILLSSGSGKSQVLFHIQRSNINKETIVLENIRLKYDKSLNKLLNEVFGLKNIKIIKY